MKKFAVILLIGLFASIAFAQNWHTANQTTIGWDPVTQFDNGDPINPEEVSYRVYLSKATNPDRTDKIKLGDTTEVTYLITLTVDGCYFVGVSTVRTVDGTEVSESPLAWSNQPEYNWGLCYFTAFPAPQGLTPTP